MQLFVQPVPNTLACHPLFHHCVPVPTEARLGVAPVRPVALLRERINHAVAALPVIVILLTRDLHDLVKGKKKIPQQEEQRHGIVRSAWRAFWRGELEDGCFCSSPRRGRL